MSFVPNRDLKRLNPMSNDCMGNNCLAMIALAFYNSKANFWEEIYNG